PAIRLVHARAGSTDIRARAPRTILSNIFMIGFVFFNDLCKDLSASIFQQEHHSGRPSCKNNEIHLQIQAAGSLSASHRKM
ncbi:hypothetical protein, partial [Duncaniella muris]|uniref:hypothetical protein n=1 Tax=Duncaniella muris TaxID=2094150 RepID=UPI003F738722